MVSGTDTVNMMAVATFLALTVWLLVLYLYSRAQHRVPLPMTGLALIGLFLVNAYSNSFLTAVVSLAIGLVVGLVLAYIGALSLTTTTAIVSIIVALPSHQWAWMLPSLLAVAVYSAFLLWRASGGEYLSMLANETLAGVGVEGGAVGKPDPSRVPLNVTEMEGDSSYAKASRVKVNVLSFLLVNSALASLVAFLVYR